MQSLKCWVPKLNYLLRCRHDSAYLISVWFANVRWKSQWLNTSQCTPKKGRWWPPTIGLRSAPCWLTAAFGRLGAHWAPSPGRQRLVQLKTTSSDATERNTRLEAQYAASRQERTYRCEYESGNLFEYRIPNTKTFNVSNINRLAALFGWRWTRGFALMRRMSVWMPKKMCIRRSHQ